jgi:hypothetical protein
MARFNLPLSADSKGDLMSVRVRVRNAETGSTVDMELEEENTVTEIIEGAAGYWEKDAGAYVIRKGKKLLRGQQSVLEAGIISADELELIPDPEGG